MKENRIKLITAWFDLWVGAYWNADKRWLYIFPIPCVGFRIAFKPKPRICPKCGAVLPIETVGTYQNMIFTDLEKWFVEPHIQGDVYQIMYDPDGWKEKCPNCGLVQKVKQ